MLGDFGAVGKLLERFEKVMTPPLEGVKDDFYAYLPYPLEHFLDGMHHAQRLLISEDRWDSGCTFIDVGCGIGTKMALASYLGWRVKGIELYTDYLTVARQLLPHAPLVISDATAWKDYDADLVYSFRLCVDADAQRRLTHHITENMRSGSLLFLVGGPDPDWLGDPVGPNLWRIPER